MKRTLGYFVAAALVATVGLFVLAHLIVNADAQHFQRERAVLVGRSIAWVFGSELTGSDPGRTQAYIDGMARHLPGTRSALVLKGVAFSAHSDPARAGSRLDRESLSDKALYDAAKTMKADVRKNADERLRSPDLEREPYPEATLMVPDGPEPVWRARVPVKVDGAFKALVQIEMEGASLPAPFPVILLVIAVVAAGVFAPLSLRLRGWPLVGAGTILLGVMLFLQVEQLKGWRQTLRLDQSSRLAQTVLALSETGLARPDELSEPSLLEELGRTADGRQTHRIAALRPPGGGADIDSEAVFRNARGDEVELDSSYLTASTQADRRELHRWGLGMGALALLIYILGITGRLTRIWKALQTHRSAYAYMSPAMLGLVILVFIPVAYGLSLGFQTRIYNEYTFVGLQNYASILSSWDISNPRNFYFTLGVTVMWTVSNITLHVGIGLFLALLLNDQMLKAKGIYRVILVVPWAIPNYVTALIWKSMFHKQFGAVNAFLETLGFQEMSWFQTFWPAFVTNVTTNTWLGFPFMMVVSLGALQSIPTDLYEAARVDGASRWQRFSRITLPLLMPALVPAVIVGTVWTFNMFNIIYLVSGGAPNGATDILITEAYRWAFEADQKGFAAAYSTVIFLILLVFTLVTNRFTGATKGAFD